MLLVDVVVRLVCVLRRPVETPLCDPFYELSAQLSSCICHTVSCSLYILFHVIINVNYMLDLYRIQLDQSHLTDFLTEKFAHSTIIFYISRITTNI